MHVKSLPLSPPKKFSSEKSSNDLYTHKKILHNKIQELFNQTIAFLKPYFQ